MSLRSKAVAVGKMNVCVGAQTVTEHELIFAKFAKDKCAVLNIDSAEFSDVHR